MACVQHIFEALHYGIMYLYIIFFLAYQEELLIISFIQIYVFSSNI